MSYAITTLNRAHQAIRDGRIFEAEALITSVLTIEPQNPWAWALLADITSNPIEAAQYRAKVVELARLSESQEAGTFSPSGVNPQQPYPFGPITPYPQQQPPYKPTYQSQPYPQQSHHQPQKKKSIGCAGFIMFMIAVSCFGSMFTSSDKPITSSQQSNPQGLVSQHTSIPKRSTPATKENVPTKGSTVPPFEVDVTLPARINLRKGPGTGFEVMTVLSNNAKVTIVAFTIASGERWYEVKWEQTSGWISASVTPVDESLASLIPESTKEFSTIPPTPTIAPKPTAKPVAPAATRRVGAICRDGWRSYSTGRGTCSHHGGVDHWLYGP